jgi:glucokinase
VGVDLGGTRLRVGVVDPGGRVLRSTVVPSSTGLAPAANPGYLAELIDGLLAETGMERGVLRGIGIGTTGPVDTSTGRIDNPYTLPGWTGVSLLAPLTEHFGTPVWIDNDAAAAALGEYWLGAGAGSERMVMVTIGTGIGGALVVDGRLYHGARGFHPELGHQVVDPSGPACYCGASGCWEQFAAGPAIGRAWADARRARGDLAGERGGSENLFAAGRAGDADAQAIIAGVGRYLGLGLINVVAFYAPDLVVLGGGVAQHFDLLEPGMRAALDRVAGCQPPGGVALHASRLGDAAGILGGAYMVLAPESLGVHDVPEE